MNKQVKFFLDEFKAVLRQRTNSPSYPLTSAGYLIRIFFDPRRLIKLFDPLVWRIVLSYTFNPPGLTGPKKILHLFNLTIKSGIFIVVAVLIYRSNNHFNHEILVARKRFFREVFPILITSTEPQTDTLEEAVGSSPVDKLPILLLSPPKGTTISGMRTQREIQQLIKERSIFSDPSVLEPEQAEPEQAEPEQAEPEQAEPEQAEPEQAEPEQAEPEQAEPEQAEPEQEEREQAAMEQAEDSAMSRLWEVAEQFTWNHTTRSLSSGLSNLLAELPLSKRLNSDRKLLKKEHPFWVLRRYRQAETREILKLFKIIPYLHNTVSIQPIPDPSSTNVPLPSRFGKFADKMTEFEFAISKIPRPRGFRKFRNVQENYDKMTEFEKRVFLMLRFLAETITTPIDRQKFFRDGPIFTSEKYGVELNLDYDLFMGENWIDQKMIFLLAPPNVSEENAWYDRRTRKKEQKKKVVVANNKIMEAVNQSRLIRNLIQFQSTTYKFIRTVLNRFFHNCEFIISKFITSKFITIKTYKNPYILMFRTVSTRQNAVSRSTDYMQGEGQDWDKTEINPTTGKTFFPDNLPHFLIKTTSSMFFSVEYPLSAMAENSEEWAEYRYRQTYCLGKLHTWLKDLKDLCSDQNRFKFSFVLVNPFVFLKKWPSFFLDDHDHQPCQKISNSMLYSFYDELKKKPEDPEKKLVLLKSFRASLPKTHSDLSMLFDDPYDWLNPVKPFLRSSLISAFYKANGLQFVNKPDYFSFYCNKRFPFSVEKAPINYYQFIYRQFLNTLFIRNKKFSLGIGQKPHPFSERDLLSAIQSEVSKILKSLDFPGGSDPFSRRVSSSILDNHLRRIARKPLIVDISTTPLPEHEILDLERIYSCIPDDPLIDPFANKVSDVDSSGKSRTEKEIESLEGTYWQASGINLPTLDSEVPNFDESFSDININLDDFEGINLDEALSDINLADSEAMNFDESLSDINLDDSEATNFDEFLSDINLYLDDLEATNFDKYFSDINLDDDNSDKNLDDLEGINLDEALSDINRATLDFEATKYNEVFSDINLDDLERTNFHEFLSALHAKLQTMTLGRSMKFNSKILMILCSLFEKISGLALQLEKRRIKDRHRRRQYDIFIKKTKLRHLYLTAVSKKMRMDKKKSAFSTRRSKRNLFKKYLSHKKWKLFKQYLPAVLTWSGLRYETSLFLEIVSDLWRRRWDRHRRRLRVSEINVPLRRWRTKWRINWRNRRHWPTQWRKKWTRWRKNWPLQWSQWKSKWEGKWTRQWRQWSNKWTTQWTRQWTQWSNKWTTQWRQWRKKWTQWRKKWTTQWTQWATHWTTYWMTYWMTQWMKQWTKLKEKWQNKFQKWAPEFKKWDSQVFNLMVLVNGIMDIWKDIYPDFFIFLKKLWLHCDNKSLTSDVSIETLSFLFSFVVISFVCLALLQSLVGFLDVFLTVKKVKSLVMDELMIEIELDELLAESHPSQSPSLGLRFANLCIGLLEKMLFPNPYGLRVKKKRKFLNINFRPIINLIKLLSNELIFLIKTRYISAPTKEIYSFLRQRKKVAAYWSPRAHWISNYEAIEDEERDVLMQFVSLRRKTSISEILWSLTYSDQCLGKDDILPELIEQPGEVYLRKVIDFHKKDLLNYEFDISCLLEKRIFLALYYTMTYPPMHYSQTSSGFDPVLSRKKPFSLRLSLAPSKSILVIGSIGLGRSYLVNYLAQNSYLPFIPICLDKFRGMRYRFDEDVEDEYLEENAFEAVIPNFSLQGLDEPEMLREDMKDLDDTDDWFPLRGVLNFFKAHFEEPDFEVRQDLERVSRDEYTEDMETVPYAPTFYSCLQIELAKAMSPCLIWIPNIHEMNFTDSDFFTLGLLSHLLSWDSERPSSSNNLVIASTHMPQQMEPSLIDMRRFNMCIKVRRPSILQQRKNFAILSYTRGFRLEREIFKITHGFESLTLGSNMEDLAALTNEALLISLSQGKSIIDSNTIRHALHRQTWDLRAELRPINNSRILFYQIGRVVVHYELLNDCPIDPISNYMNKRFCREREPYLYRWYYQLGMSMKKLTILIYVLTCSSGLVAQELWAPSELDANNGLVSASLLDQNFDLVHGLLEIEGVLEGFLPTEKDCRQFDKDQQVRVVRRHEPRNPLDMIHNGFWSMIDEKMIYEKDPLAPPIIIGGIEMDLPKMFENFILWAPRTWSPWGFLFDWIEKANANELGFPYWSRTFFAKQIESILFNYYEDFEENDSHSDQDEDESEENPSPLEHKDKKKDKSTFYKLPEDYGVADDYTLFNPYHNYSDEDNEEVSEAFVTSLYQTRARIKSCQEQIFFGITQFIWDPGNPFLILSEDPYIAPLFFSDREFFPDLDQEKWFFTGDIKTMEKSWFIPETQAKHCERLIQRQKSLRKPKKSLSKGSFRATALSESYQYLSNFLISKKTLVNQMQKLLVKKRWLFPDDMKNFFTKHYHHHPAETQKN